MASAPNDHDGKIVAGGELRYPSPAGADSLYRIGFTVRKRGEGVWVDLDHGTGGAVPLPGSAVQSLMITLQTQFPEEFGSPEMRSVGVSSRGLHVGYARTVGTSALLTLVGGLGLAVGLGWLALRIRRERRRYALLADLAQHQVVSREEERARVARELHDGPVQELNVMALEASSGLAAQVEPERLRAVATELRNLAGGLRPAALDRFGLATALGDLCSAVEARCVATLIETRIPAHLPPLGVNTELAVYRVAQEALHNAVTHGKARRVDVVLTESGGGIRLTVTDDGVGFPKGLHIADVVRSGHYGLAGMQERARGAGGTFALGPGPEGGACVSIWLPVRTPSPEAGSSAPHARQRTGRRLGSLRLPPRTAPDRPVSENDT